MVLFIIHRNKNDLASLFWNSWECYGTNRTAGRHCILMVFFRCWTLPLVCEPISNCSGSKWKTEKSIHCKMFPYTCFHSGSFSLSFSRPVEGFCGYGEFVLERCQWQWSYLMCTFRNGCFIILHCCHVFLYIYIFLYWDICFSQHEWSLARYVWSLKHRAL